MKRQLQSGVSQPRRGSPEGSIKFNITLSFIHTKCGRELAVVYGLKGLKIDPVDDQVLVVYVCLMRSEDGAIAVNKKTCTHHRFYRTTAVTSYLDNNYSH